MGRARLSSRWRTTRFGKYESIPIQGCATIDTIVFGISRVRDDNFLHWQWDPYGYQIFGSLQRMSMTVFVTDIVIIGIKSTLLLIVMIIVLQISLYDFHGTHVFQNG
jgi:hypothetical protein